MEFLVAGDIGGTNARFRIFVIDGKFGRFFKDLKFRCQDFGNFDEVLSAITSEISPIKISVFSVAGPVFNNTTSFTNNDHWNPKTSDALTLQQKFSIPQVIFLNDFEGAGYGCLSLSSEDYIQINPHLTPVPPSPSQGSKYVVGSGTGWGEAFIAFHDNSYKCWAGEGGASDFAPHSQEDWEISQFLSNLVQSTTELEQFQPCETAVLEMCLGGIGAVYLYEFFKNKHPELVDFEFDDLWTRQKDDRMKMLMENGLDKNDKLCELSVNAWIRFLGYSLGNCIAQYRPMGGIYVIGGVVSKNFDEIVKRKEEIFKVVEGKPRHVRENLIWRVPIYLVRFYDVGVLGSAWYAMKVAGLQGFAG